MKKTAIVADLHIGVHRSDQKWIDWMVEYSKYLDAKLKSLGVDSICILGDVFNNRKEISTPAIDCAKNFFDNLKDYEIKMLIGNHDCFYDSSTEISSVSIFSNWPNITVVKDVMDISIGGHRGLMVSWGQNIENIGKTGYEFIMGHFEISSFHMSSYQICENGFSSASLLAVSPLVFSGHFHMQDDRKYSGGRIVYVGSPYELDWGDCGIKKRFLVFDGTNVDSVENDFSPVHVVVDAADLYSEKDHIKGNIVKIVSDKLVFENGSQINAVIDEARSLGAAEITCDIKVAPPINESVEVEKTSMDPGDALVGYVEKKCDYADEVKSILYCAYCKVRGN